MSRKVWLALSLLLNLVGGLQDGLVPAMGAKAVGITLDAAGLETLRFVGALQLGFALLSWMGMRVTSADGQRAIDRTICGVYLFGTVYAVRELLVTQVSVGFLVQAVVAAVLGIAFGYIGFGGRGQELQQVGTKSRAAGQ
jgi:uncharacterized protein YjeT (DUF2065 family)